MKRIVLACVLCFAPSVVSAQVYISEVMYDLAEGSDSGREWVEVYNAGAAPIDLTSWKIVEGGKGHALKAVSAKTLSAGSYAIVADNPEKFKTDYPAFSGILFDSAFALNNSGETLGLSDGKVVRDTFLYTSSQGGNGTGDSLQRLSSGSFEAGTPTPGAGIPAGGLVKSTPKQKSVAGRTPSSIEAMGTISGKGDAAPGMMLVAAAGAAPTPQYVWWLAPLFLGLTGSVGIAWSRHYKKDEWDIVEDLADSS